MSYQCMLCEKLIYNNEINRGCCDNCAVTCECGEYILASEYEQCELCVDKLVYYCDLCKFKHKKTHTPRCKCNLIATFACESCSAPLCINCADKSTIDPDCNVDDTDYRDYYCDSCEIYRCDYPKCNNKIYCVNEQYSYCNFHEFVTNMKSSYDCDNCGRIFTLHEIITDVCVLCSPNIDDMIIDRYDIINPLANGHISHLLIPILWYLKRNGIPRFLIINIVRFMAE